MPVYVHVIDHPDGRVLVDTGMTELHPAMADMDPRLRPLSEQDFDLAGIDIVVNTHLHADHCGGNHLFAGKPIYVQRRELDDVRSKDDYTFREWVDAPGVRYVPVDGEHELLPGLRLVPAPGHTPRHADGRRRDWRAPGHRRRRRGGLVRRVRRAAHRRPAAGPCARPRARLAHARARAMATRTGRGGGRGGSAVTLTWRRVGLVGCSRRRVRQGSVIAWPAENTSSGSHLARTVWRPFQASAP